MELTADQEQSVQSGRAVRVIVGGTDCVLLRKDVYDTSDGIDYSPLTAEEMNLLATETADLLAGDGFDEPDDE